MTAGTCQYCGCAENQACPGPCRWRDDTRTVCSACDDGEKIARVLVEVFPRTIPGRSRPATFDAFASPDAQRLVMVCRAAAETWIEGTVADVIGETLEDLRELMAFLDERFRGEMRPEESPTSMAIRLLSEGRTTRIIVP